MERKTHRFDNAVSVYDDHLIAEQRARYAKRNVHEAEEEEIFVDLIGAIGPGGCFVDIGAAIGYYVILARKLSPSLEIHAVEPLERHRAFLLENLTLNAIEGNEITVHPEGIASAEGSASLLNRGYGSRIPRAADEAKPSLSTRWKALLVRVGLRDPNRKPPKVLAIQTITLDTLLQRIGRPVDLLQMDVQGLEADVLNGGIESLRAGRIRTFLIGTHGREIHQRCMSVLREHGYEVTIDKFETVAQPDGILVATRR
jgi:FkbM family methyltransferase